MCLRVRVRGAITPVARLRPPNTRWTIKARVSRLWNNESVIIPGKLISTEMILVDQDGGRIHATVPPRVVDRWRNVIREGQVYVISCFNVYRNTGLCMHTTHDYRISLIPSSEVHLDDSYMINRFGVSLSSSKEIKERVFGNRHLVDVMGLLTGLYYDYVVDSSDNMSTVVRLELTDDRGKVECALSGSYVAIFKDMLRRCRNVLPIVVIQFVKSGRDGGVVLVKSVEKVTRLLFNPAISEALLFRNRFVMSRKRIRVGYVPHSYPAVTPHDSEFNMTVPRKSVSELVHTGEDGLFVVLARIVTCFQVEKIWYPLCGCESVMTEKNGLFVCGKCNLTTFNPSIKLRIVVDDGNATARFQCFDQLLYGLSIVNFNRLGLRYVLSEEGFKELKGKDFLFIVKKTPPLERLAGEKFEVVRITNDSEIIKNYHAIGDNYTPIRCVFKPPFSEVPPSGADGGPVSTALSLAGNLNIDEPSTSYAYVSGFPSSPEEPMDLGDAALSLAVGNSPQ